MSNLIKNDCTEFSTTGDCLIRPCLENSWLINFEFQFLVVGLLILICFLRWQNIAVGIIFFLLLVNTSMLIIFATVEDVSAAHNIRNIFPKIQANYWNNFQIVSILIELTYNNTCDSLYAILQNFQRCQNKRFFRTCIFVDFSLKLSDTNSTIND